MEECLVFLHRDSNERIQITKKENHFIEVVSRYYNNYGRRHRDEDRHEAMLADWLRNKRCWGGEEIQKFTASLSIEEFVDLFILKKYDVVKNAEELLLEFFNKVGDSEQKHIVKSLNILGLNIEGINV